MILKTASEKGVKVLSLDEQGLQVEFFDRTQKVAQVEQLPTYDQTEEVDLPEEPATPMDHEELKLQMLIDDPLALEEMVMRGDNQL